MAAPKAKSLQQKLGFFDEDLKNPTHDEILKWLDINIEKVLLDVYVFDKWDDKKVKSLENETLQSVKYTLDKSNQQKNELIGKIEKYPDDETYKKELIDLEKKIKYYDTFNGLSKELPVRQKPRILEKIWEYTVCNQTTNYRTGYQSSKSIIGFVDMKVEFEFTNLEVKGVEYDPNKENQKIEWGQTNRDQYNDISKHSVFIEVKTKITSLGELFRQLNTYKEFVNGSFLVVCPDDSEKEVIRSQGFSFYKYKE